MLTNYIDKEVLHIAAQFRQYIVSVKKAVGVHHCFRENRNPSLYNALMHKKAQEYHCAYSLCDFVMLLTLC